MRLVLDASVAVNALLPTPLQRSTLDHLAGNALYAPSLIDTEVLSALARLERAGTLDRAQAGTAVAQWSRLPCERVDSSRLLAEVWALRQAIRVSDAHYVALARRLEATLLTADARFARASLREVSILLVS